MRLHQYWIFDTKLQTETGTPYKDEGIYQQ